MAAPTKTKKIESLARLLNKRYKGIPTPPNRSILEHLIFSAIFENAIFEQSEAAFAVLENYFIDWNEVRVSTARELADTFPMLPHPLEAGERVRRVLQGVFERTYMFDLEELRKKGKSLGQAIEFLESIHGCTRFMVDYTARVAFEGHLFPLDEASLRVFRLLGITQVNKNNTKEDVPGIDRIIPKKKGLVFCLQLHQFANEHFEKIDSKEFRALLKGIDSEAMDRSWTAPVLNIPEYSKPIPKPKPRSLGPTISFGAPDEDDFDEDIRGAETGFLPNENLFGEYPDSPTCHDHLPEVSVKRKRGRKPKSALPLMSDIPPQVTKAPEKKPTPASAAPEPPSKGTKVKKVAKIPKKLIVPKGRVKGKNVSQLSKKTALPKKKTPLTKPLSQKKVSPKLAKPTPKPVKKKAALKSKLTPKISAKAKVKSIVEKGIVRKKTGTKTASLKPKFVAKKSGAVKRKTK